LGVRVNLLGSNQKRIGLVADNCNLSSLYDELVDELID